MGYRVEGNYRQPEFCADCPAFEGMENIEVRRTTNDGPDLRLYVGGMPPDKEIYAWDPDNPDAGAVTLGRDGITDPFCGCCEYSTSRALGNAHSASEACAGPVTETNWRGKDKPSECGAGYRNTGARVLALNEIGRKQGIKFYSNLDIILQKEERKSKERADQIAIDGDDSTQFCDNCPRSGGCHGSIVRIRSHGSYSPGTINQDGSASLSMDRGVPLGPVFETVSFIDDTVHVSNKMTIDGKSSQADIMNAIENCSGPERNGLLGRKACSAASILRPIG